MENYNSNKDIVLDFWKRSIGQGDLALAEKLIADAYTQHSTMGKPGKAGLLEALAMLKQVPKPAYQPKPFMRIIADGDYVALHMLIEFGGKKKLVLDLVRLSGGLFAEHWDAVQDIPSEGVNANALIHGAFEIEDEHLTTQNRLLVHAFVKTILIEKKYEKLYEFVSANFHHHSVNAVFNFNSEPEEFTVRSVHRILVEGNFSLVQIKGESNNLAVVRYVIYRLHSSRIVEQWCVEQNIPENMPHENGMI